MVKMYLAFPPGVHVTATLASTYRPTDMVSVTAIPLSVIDSFRNVLVGPMYRPGTEAGRLRAHLFREKAYT